MSYQIKQQHHTLPRNFVRIGYGFRLGLIIFITATTFLAH